MKLAVIYPLSRKVEVKDARPYQEILKGLTT
jgi:hypothetical protein